MEKIYSRKRIKIPKIKYIKKDKKHKVFWLRILCFLIILIVLFDVIYFLYASYPIFKASCETAAASRATNIVTDEVQNVMEEYSYRDLMNIEKNDKGDITFMQANTVLINKIISRIVSNIQTRLDNSPTATVYINYGSVSGITFLKDFGPKFEIDLEAAGKTRTKLLSEFQSINVNQSIHRIYLELTTSFGILTPIGSFGHEVESKVLLTEAVIVGDVPQTYYNLENMKESDALNLVE